MNPSLVIYIAVFVAFLIVLIIASQAKLQKFLEFLEESNGQFSSARLLSFLVTIAIIVDYMHAIFTVGKWQPDINLILILLVVVTGKTIQKFGEDKPGNEIK